MTVPAEKSRSDEASSWREPRKFKQVDMEWVGNVEMREAMRAALWRRQGTISLEYPFAQERIKLGY